MRVNSYPGLVPFSTTQPSGKNIASMVLSGVEVQVCFELGMDKVFQLRAHGKEVVSAVRGILCSKSWNQVFQSLASVKDGVFAVRVVSCGRN